jgi:hypothetical protein
MKGFRFILLFALMAIGICVGLFYGWVVNPVTYMNTTADSLRVDYKTDVVLMTAEIYSMDGNLDRAMNRLSWVENDGQVALLQDCLAYARKYNFSEVDLDSISRLLHDVSLISENVED